MNSVNWATVCTGTPAPTTSTLGVPPITPTGVTPSADAKTWTVSFASQGLAGTYQFQVLPGVTDASSYANPLNRDGDWLNVCYTTDAPWSLAETHLHVAADPAEFPQTRTGNPKPGQFDYAMSQAPGTSSHTDCVPLAGLEDAFDLHLRQGEIAALIGPEDRPA